MFIYIYVLIYRKITYILLLNIGCIICVFLSIIIILFVLFWCMNSLPDTGTDAQLSICKCKKCNKSEYYNLNYLYK